jgi:hypothetical protein
MNEAETIDAHILPALKAAGWGVVEGSRIRHTYATNGQGIYAIDMQTGRAGRPRGGLPHARATVGHDVRQARCLARPVCGHRVRGQGRFASQPILPGHCHQAGDAGHRGGADAHLVGAGHGQDLHRLSDFSVIDECHRGGANDESTWRDILEYFKPAVQLGLTATPKRKDNVDTYRYFGEPVFTYSLKEGINDGFLTPFKLKQIQTTLDYYVYRSDDTVVEGEVQAGKLYDEPDFNKIIEIREWEKKRVEIFLSQISPNDKTLVFCAYQAHALVVRDLINQLKTSKDPNYCQRVTADDGVPVSAKSSRRNLARCAVSPRANARMRRARSVARSSASATGGGRPG